MNLLERHAPQIAMVLSCYDRLIIQGTLQHVGYADGMRRHLFSRHVRIFDFPLYARTFTALQCTHMQRLAARHHLTIQFVAKASTRKEDLIADIVVRRGNHPGIVAILSAMESCTSFRPWHDKNTHRTFLRHTGGKCLHYYVYFIDPDYGLCHLRIPTWLPAGLQFYCNGHSYVARQLTKKGVSYRMADNLFLAIADPIAAQTIADAFSPHALHGLLERCVRAFCPIAAAIGDSYHWSISQAEYATDVLFKRQQDLAAVYEHLTRTAIHTVKPDAVATFLGHRLSAAFNDELGNRFDTRILGTRIRHSMGPAAIKMYDKAGIALRIESSTVDVRFFSRRRPVHRRDGTVALIVAPLRKAIFSLPALRTCLHSANRRYLDFISHFDCPAAGAHALCRITTTVTANQRPYAGLNFFDPNDLALLTTIARGDACISGLRNKHIRAHLKSPSPNAVSRALKRLRVHGLIRRVVHTYKYYLTALGRRVVTLALRIRQLIIIPSLARPATIVP